MLFLETYVVLCLPFPPYFRARRARVLPVADSDPVCHQVMNVVQPEDWVVLGAGPPARRLALPAGRPLPGGGAALRRRPDAARGTRPCGAVYEYCPLRPRTASDAPGARGDTDSFRCSLESVAR